MDIYLPIAGMSVNALVIIGMGALVGFLSGMFGAVPPLRDPLGLAGRTVSHFEVRAPLGAGGPITITFYNTVNSAIDMQLAGSTAHEFTLPACTGFPEAYAAGTGEDACDSPVGRPLFAVGLNAGTHHLLADFEGSGKMVKQFDAAVGGFDLYCLYVENGN